MNLSIYELKTLHAVKPLDLAAYLRANQWHETERQEGQFAFWHRNGDGDTIEILLPLNRAFRDYTSRIAEALHTLEVAEQRSQREILTDIHAITNDITRIAAEHESLADGTLPLKGAVQFVESAYSLILAAACSTVRPRAVFYARRPAPATEHMQQVRMGQSEQGSYVVTIHSPITPGLRMPAQVQLLEEPEEPFTRRVSQTLMQALVAVRAAAEESIASGEFQPFLDAVRRGVSANLCDALVGLQTGSDASQVRIRMSWSPTRTMDLPIAGQVLIPSDAIAVIKEAARFLRETTSREEFELTGLVVNLRRTKRSQAGMVTIVGLVDETYRNIQVALESSDYEQAVEAHKKGWQVHCEGELTREGHKFVLRNPRRFVVDQPLLLQEYN